MVQEARQGQAAPPASSPSSGTPPKPTRGPDTAATGPRVSGLTGLGVLEGEGGATRLDPTPASVSN